MAERPQFVDQLRSQWDQGKYVCVGLDADWDRLPQHLASQEKQSGQTNFNVRAQATYDFLAGIVDATADTALAYKPNIAFFEDQHRTELALSDIVGYIHNCYPNIPVIGDVKRADIGNTNKGYAKAMFERYGFDAITLNSQYFGGDTLKPFEEYPNKGLIIMSKTSNPGSREIQDMPIDIDLATEEGLLTEEEFLDLNDKLGHNFPSVYEMVAYLAHKRWDKSGNLGLVVGATHPEAFATVRRLSGDIPFLVPGIGSQGGGDKELAMIWENGLDSRKQGVIINSGSKIIFASSGKDFAEAARAETLKLHNQITEIRS